MSIVVERVTKRFGDFVALDGVSVEVQDGALTALLGPSGSGKSTLLRVIAGLEQPDSGAVSISGAEATSLPPQRRGVGFVFQHYAAFKHMTVWDNIAFGLTIRKRPKAEISKRVSELLELVHLDGFADRYPSQLSGGQRQRMALARALAVEPKVLLLDEPFGALDARVRKDLRLWLRRLHDEVHVTTIFVTHDQEEAMEIAEQIVVMNEGTIEQVGAPRDLYEHPENEFVMSFVGPVNRLGDEFIRPHDFELRLEPNGTTEEAMIDRIVHLGFEVRVEFTLPNGQHAWAQLTRESAEELELERGQIVYVRPGRSRVFDAADRAGEAVRPSGPSGQRGPEPVVPPKDPPPDATGPGRP
jgi:sulfate transport system ATP-binding protein